VSVDMDLKNSSSIVTGGASGIGAATARRFAALGSKVVIADLQAEKGEALAKEIGGAFCKVDVTKTEDIVAAIEMAASMGPIRALVNSAGIGWAQRTIGKDGNYDSAHNLDVFRSPRRCRRTNPWHSASAGRSSTSHRLPHSTDRSVRLRIRHRRVASSA